ncbi:hypothetical protein M514_08130 [Trichuris suis]|uniref:Histone deacetylase 8 n=1 Tax=Trichuris suis TaxID=68888 RepID=A0A085M152_9BILA|nr:hypothetical protein M513_08130 [Trichuris suis]KFD71873.1 hypothetical protein M514_08130 [Trichuris suis]
MSSTEGLAKKDVALAYSPHLSELCDSVETLQKRTSITFSLIQAYGLFEHVKVFKPTSASKEQLVYFHSSDYVEFLRSSSEPNRNLELLEREGELEHGFGVGYDCPLFASLYAYGTRVAGASIQCADLLNKGEAKVAINICGGWHHARRSQAAGFCYFNDCVLSILKLRERYKRILYVDLDVHHGDGASLPAGSKL